MVLHYREALEFVGREDVFKGADVEICRWEGSDFGGHNAGDGDAEGGFFFGVKEGEAVKPDHAICYAPTAEAVRDGFCDADYNLC